jgi:hypothetical protein
LAIESCPKTGSFDFYFNKASSVKQADLRDMFKKPSQRVCTSTAVASELLSPTPSTSSLMKTPENTEEPADGLIQMEYSSD